ncbi:hypothetical protein KP509_1Z080400 [Ceratopteris richardii]|nr:hypothetical protein KP509_1Z080400 [Ceratopteris richardii]
MKEKNQHCPRGIQSLHLHSLLAALFMTDPYGLRSVHFDKHFQESRYLKIWLFIGFQCVLLSNVKILGFRGRTTKNYKNSPCFGYHTGVCCRECEAQNKWLSRRRDEGSSSSFLRSAT